MNGIHLFVYGTQAKQRMFGWLGHIIILWRLVTYDHGDYRVTSFTEFMHLSWCPTLLDNLFLRSHETLMMPLPLESFHSTVS